MKKYKLALVPILFAIAIIFVNSCNTIKVASPTENAAFQTISHNGVEREYLIHVPPSYQKNKSVPLLLSFHGYTNSANELMETAQFNTLADKNDFIVIYPQGLIYKSCCTFWNADGFFDDSIVDDIGFVDKLIDNIADKYNIDTNRIYSTGFSNGAFMSFDLACKLSTKIAAIASVGGSMTSNMYNSCNPSHQIPILMFHGTKDENVPWEGMDDLMIPQDTLISYWSKFNKTNADVVQTQIKDLNKKDNITVKKHSYKNGLNGSEVILYKVTNGKHKWYEADKNENINTSEIIWDFLSQYDINGEIKK